LPAVKPAGPSSASWQFNFSISVFSVSAFNICVCGRYTITEDLAGLEKLVRFICMVVDFKPRYNLAPRAHAPVLVWENGQPTLKPMRWGLIPSWSKDEIIGDKLTNARADTIIDKFGIKPAAFCGNATTPEIQ